MVSVAPKPPLLICPIPIHAFKIRPDEPRDSSMNLRKGAKQSEPAKRVQMLMSQTRETQHCRRDEVFKINRGPGCGWGGRRDAHVEVRVSF